MTVLVNKIEDIREFVRKAKRDNKTVGLVPTMGALHAGHESLIKKSKEIADVTIVSIYVNPTQFGEGEDFSKYPRTLEADLQICKNHGVDVVFAPSTDEMYDNSSFLIPHSSLTCVTPPLSMTEILCGKSRPGHFDGVATVVVKLFNIATPDFAFFGQKDAQQLIILKKVAADLNIPVEIIACPIVRDETGLALSSRNSYLSETGKEKALILSKILNDAKNLYVSQKIDDFKEIFETALSLMKPSPEFLSSSLAKKFYPLPEVEGNSPDVELEYFECVDSSTFQKCNKLKKGSLLAIAASVEGVRLIDNIIL